MCPPVYVYDPVHSFLMCPPVYVYDPMHDGFRNYDDVIGIYGTKNSYCLPTDD
jgi:hypothetical protein